MDKRDKYRDFLKKQSHEQLEIFLLNEDLVEDNLRSRLFLLTGCGDFGGQDGTNGSCVECYYNNRDLHDRCCLFQVAAHTYLMNKEKQEKENLGDVQ